MAPAAHSAPLAGLRVLDLAHLLPGEFTTLWLAALGAEVIKVEAPAQGSGPEPFGEAGRLVREIVNRGKRSIKLDLRQPQGQEILRRLAARADVLVEGFRPGVMARLGADYATLRAVNPHLVYCSLTGFGQDGPYRNRPAHDLNYVALAGLLAENYGGEAGAPHPLPFQLADVGGGALAALVRILAALHARQATGEGQYLDIALLDHTLAFATLLLPFARRPFARLLSGGAPCYNVYETGDGRYLAVAALEPKFWEHLCRRIERPDLIPFGQAVDAEGAARLAELRALFRTRPLAEWLALIDPEQTCVSPVLSPDEVEADPHIRRRGLIDRAGGTPLIDLPGLSLPALSAAPRPGQHTDEILRELGYGDDRG